MPARNGHGLRNNRGLQAAGDDNLRAKGYLRGVFFEGVWYSPYPPVITNVMDVWIGEGSDNMEDGGVIRCAAPVPFTAEPLQVLLVALPSASSGTR